MSLWGYIIRGGLALAATGVGYWGVSKVKLAYDARNRRALKYSTVQSRRGILYAIGYQNLIKLDTDNLGRPVPAEAIKAFQADWIRLAKAAVDKASTGEVSDLLKSVHLEPDGEWSDSTFEALEKANAIVNLANSFFPKVEV